jgi:hypothetical protein
MARKYAKDRPFKPGRRLWVFLVCFVISAASWMMITLSRDYTEFYKFRISFRNANSMEALLGDIPDSVRLEIRATGFDLLGFRARQILEIDYASIIRYSKDSVYYMLSNSRIRQLQKQLGENYEIISIRPDTLFLKLGKGERKKVPVRWMGNLYFQPPYYMADSPMVSPAFVEIFGPSSITDSIRFIQTEVVNFNNINSSFHKKVALRQPGIKGLSFRLDSVELVVAVQKFTEASFQIPVDVMNLPEGYVLKLVPKNVEVKCLIPFTKLNKISEENFKAWVDFATINKDEDRDVKVNVTTDATGLRQVRSEPERVEFILRVKK